jgi:hypothetical protein
MKKQHIIFILVLFLFGCSTTKWTIENTSGLYYRPYDPNYYTVDDILILRPDSTFEYTWKAGLINGKTIGDWNLYKGNIYLNSTNDPPEEIDTIESFVSDQKFLDGQEKLTVKVYDDSGDIISFYTIMAVTLEGDTLWASGNENGIGYLDVKSGTTISVTFVGHKSIENLIVPDNVNYLEIVLGYAPLRWSYYYQKFEDYKIKIFKNGDLLFQRRYEDLRSFINNQGLAEPLILFKDTVSNVDNEIIIDK